MSQLRKTYERHKRFNLEADAKPTTLPSLQLLALELASIVGQEEQQAFSRSLDWTQPTKTLVKQYQERIEKANDELEDRHDAILAAKHGECL